jgi:hypothetical protein
MFDRMFDGTGSMYFHSGARGNYMMWDSRVNYGVCYEVLLHYCSFYYNI